LKALHTLSAYATNARLTLAQLSVPAGKTIHAIIDNYAAHKHPKLRQWLARHPRWTFHFTPHFGVLAQRRRGISRNTHKAPTEARRVPIRRRSPSRHQSLSPRAQPTIETLHLDHWP
jgi:hypothetical protein